MTKMSVKADKAVSRALLCKIKSFVISMGYGFLGLGTKSVMRSAKQQPTGGFSVRTIQPIHVLIRAISLFLLFLLFVGVLLFEDTSNAQEVYNFYFQKGSGPTTVTQGSGSAPGSADKPVSLTPDATVTAAQTANTTTTQPVATAGTTTSTTLAATAPTEKSGTHKWEIAAGSNSMYTPTAESGTWSCTIGTDGSCENWHEDSGATEFNETAQHGMYLSGQYTLNRYVAFDGNLYTGKNMSFTNVGAGIAITPIRLNFFGHDLLEIAALGGARSLTYYDVTRDTSFAWYYGLGLNVNLSNNFGIQFETTTVKLDSNSYYEGGNSSLGLYWRI